MPRPRTIGPTEAIVLPPFVAIAIRPRPGVWEYVRVNVYELSVDQLSVAEYLCFKEELVDGQYNENYVLELDFEAFNATFPRPTRSSSISNGVEFLYRHLSSVMFRNKESLEPLLEFLRTHEHNGHVMMLNDRIQTLSGLQFAFARAEEYLSKLPPDAPYSEFDYVLQGLGFEKGWGDTAWRVSEMVLLLLDILQAPDPSTLEAFLGRIPMVFNVVIVSPHGYFGQANVLGLPDTGGQDSSNEIAAELQGVPDLIIGNYSDGNLVASLLSNKLGITQCNIAQALEKTKYPDSDLYWRKYEDKYHFSSQFTADLIAMNNTDFIITSTYQEIAGR
ncbi:hypothetical protein F0562_022293 [Nyssa sinensis]|uniref:sucrose synthase n=1 Tax=Nyssa sinensis TaxID=561372 RepID=A0A5J5BSS2_9ASTE|nr:hypothetical protein F0562_022293 [Nyssa sinensis]